MGAVTATMGPDEAAQGQGAAIVERAYRDHWAAVCRYVRKTFGAGPPEPEELAQAAFARLAGVADPSAIANAKAFLFRCARNAAIDARRQLRMRERYDDSADVGDLDQEAVNQDIERVLSGKERLAIVEEAIRNMEERRRRVLIMHAIHEQGYSDIARQLGLSRTRVVQIAAAGVAECERALAAAEAGLDGEVGQ